jgi:hypothetical protein
MGVPALEPSAELWVKERVSEAMRGVAVDGDGVPRWFWVLRFESRKEGGAGTGNGEPLLWLGKGDATGVFETLLKGVGGTCWWNGLCGGIGLLKGGRGRGVALYREKYPGE